MDQSQYIVCFGAESTMNLLQQRGGMLYNGRRASGRFRGYNRLRGAWRGNYRSNFNWRGCAWRNNRGMYGVRGRGRGRGVRGSSMMHVSSESRIVVEGSDSNAMLIDFEENSVSEVDKVVSFNKNKTDDESVIFNNSQNGADIDNCVDTAVNTSLSEFPVMNDLIFVGDSFCKRMVKAVNKSNCDHYKLCKGGITLNELKKCMNTCERNHFVGKCVVVFMGMNDVLKGDSDNFNGDAFSLILKLKEYGVTSILFCTLPIIPGEFMEKIKCFNNAVRSLNGFGGVLSVVECEKIFCNADGSVNYCFYDKCYKSAQFDFHPNVKGLKIIYGLVYTKAFPDNDP